MVKPLSGTRMETRESEISQAVAARGRDSWSVRGVLAGSFRDSKVSGSGFQGSPQYRGLDNHAYFCCFLRGWGGPYYTYTYSLHCSSFFWFTKISVIGSNHKTG